MQQQKEETIKHVVPQFDNKSYKSPFNQDFAEIYIEDENNIESEEIVAYKINKLRQPEDEKRSIFMEMRLISRNMDVSSISYDKLKTLIFYKQAKFMENFEDSFEGNATFTMYYPTYQMMSYDQLRTYFTWRSKVRMGEVEETSFSYVFIHIYELINNIGIKDCQDGLNKLIFIWSRYRKYQSSLDKYMAGWIKDYYIINEFPCTFEELYQDNSLLQDIYEYPNSESFFDFYYPFSDYKVKHSIFYTNETEKMIIGCFNSVIKSINLFMSESNGEFDDVIFYDKIVNPWFPFKKSLYYYNPSQGSKNKFVKFSDTDKYWCANGRWTSSKNRICTNNSRFVIGYILKRIEQFYRKMTKFKYKLNANKNKIDMAEIKKQTSDSDKFFAMIDASIIEYYKSSQIKTISIDNSKLEKIKANAIIIQEKLLVNTDDIETEEVIEQPEAFIKDCSPQAVAADDAWSNFYDLLNQTEKNAVIMILKNASINELLDYSIRNKLMLEVIIDNINQKAIDTINDNILEFSDVVTVFDEYKDNLERVITIE